MILEMISCSTCGYQSIENKNIRCLQCHKPMCLNCFTNKSVCKNCSQQINIIENIFELIKTSIISSKELKESLLNLGYCLENIDNMFLEIPELTDFNKQKSTLIKDINDDIVNSFVKYLNQWEEWYDCSEHQLEHQEEK